MILAVIEKFHDYEVTQYYVDTDKLNINNYPDALILTQILQPGRNLFLVLNCTNWETDTSFNGREPQISEAAKFEITPDKIDKALYVNFFFDS